jgi:hypothetical protein
VGFELLADGQRLRVERGPEIEVLSGLTMLVAWLGWMVISVVFVVGLVVGSMKPFGRSTTLTWAVVVYFGVGAASAVGLVAFPLQFLDELSRVQKTWYTLSAVRFQRSQVLP